MQSGDPSTQANTNPPTIPDHTLLRIIGRGAYGEVWLARNIMGALRAVKIIWRRQFDSARPFEREFAGIQKFEPVSRSSGGLVHVLHVGRNEAEGYFYYVMELADGDGEPGGRWQSGKAGAPEVSLSPASYAPRTLRSDLKRFGRLPTADCLRLALDVVSGLAELHRHGLIHRDVKPGNIIYVHDRAKLADIGLVSAHGEGRTFVGTEGYIPPEGPGSPAADLYALGIALYEASTGHSPDKFPSVPTEWFTDETSNEALEFHEVILKACEGRREQRYESAEGMQADLALLQSGQSVRRMRALERRYARLRISGIVGSALLACALVAAFFANYRAKLAAESHAKEMHLREQAQSSLARAESAELDARQQLYTALLGEARAVVRGTEMGQRVRALEALRAAAAITNTAELRREVFAALALPDARFVRDLPAGTNTTMAELDPNFERIAIGHGQGPVEIRSVTNNQLLVTLPASTNLPVHFGWWSADGKYFAVKRDLGSSGRLADWEIWDVSIPRRVLFLHAVPWSGFSFHPRQGRVIASQEGEVVTWDLATGQELRRIPIAQARVILLKYSPEGDRFAAVRGTPPNQTITVHDVTDGRVLMTYSLADNLGDLKWHPAGEWMGVADFSGAVRLFHSRTNDSRLLGRHKTEAVRTAFSPDGRYLITGGWERELICWDMRRMERAFTMSVDCLTPVFRADGQMIAAGRSLFVQLRLFAFERPTGVREFTDDLGTVLQPPSFSLDGRWMAAMGQKRVGIWNLAAEGQGNLGEPAGPGRLFFTPDGSELFASIREDDCGRWRVVPSTNSAAAPELQGVSLRIPDGFNSLCLGSNQLVWTTTNGTQITTLDRLDSGLTHWFPTAAGMSWVSPDNRWLGLYRSFGTILNLYRWPSLEPAASLTNRGSIRSFAFSPLGGEVAVASSRHVEFWDTRTWQRTRDLTNFMDVLYSPDGHALWLTKDFRNAGLFDAATLRELLPLPVGSLPLALSPDGRRLAVSVDLRRLQVWDMAELQRQLAQLGLDWRE